jgi:hypothetical protein
MEGKRSIREVIDKERKSKWTEKVMCVKCIVKPSAQLNNDKDIFCSLRKETPIEETESEIIAAEETH